MERPDARSGVLLIMTLFCLQPMVIGCWFAFIPLVKTDLELSKLQLAIALLGMPSALLIALQFAGQVVERIGLRRMMAIVFPLQGLAAFLPLLAVNQGTLFLALACFGVTHAFMEVGLNVYAGRVEKAGQALIMNRCHGFWALGLMIGSFFAAQGAGALGPFLVMALVSGLSTVAGVLAARALPKIGADGGADPRPRRSSASLPRALAPIGLFMFLTTITEGAMADWSAIYLSERQGIDVIEAGFAVTIFAGFMAAGRFAGDWLKRRLGALRMAQMSAIVGASGLACLVLPLPLEFSFLGFALVGLGVAAAYPLGVSAVAALDDDYEAANVAIMSSCALAGFLIGPPLIGFLADTFGLRTGFGALIPGLLLCIWLARWLIAEREPDSRR